MNQAERVLAIFGGPRGLARVFKRIGVSRGPDGIYKWLYPKSKGGTGGLIPSHAMADIFLAAKEIGVELDMKTLDVRETEESIYD